MIYSYMSEMVYFGAVHKRCEAYSSTLFI